MISPGSKRASVNLAHAPVQVTGGPPAGKLCSVGTTSSSGRKGVDGSFHKPPPGHEVPGAGGPLWGLPANAGPQPWVPWSRASATAHHKPHRLLHRYMSCLVTFAVSLSSACMHAYMCCHAGILMFGSSLLSPFSMPSTRHYTAACLNCFHVSSSSSLPPSRLQFLHTRVNLLLHGPLLTSACKLDVIRAALVHSATRVALCKMIKMFMQSVPGVQVWRGWS